MQHTDSAILARLTGDDAAATKYFRLALELEEKAANQLVSNYEAEPTRSVLLRSAASLAIDCNELRKAERLVALALSGNPPEEIADELRDLLERVHFKRHLILRGIVLDQDEFQFSMAGKAVGLGIAENDEFFLRAQFTERVFARAAARHLGKPYGSRIAKNSKENVRLFVSQPRAASFAVTFRVGHTDQLPLPGLTSFAQTLIDDVFTCFELFNKREDSALLETIGDPAYYNNFVQMAQQLAPDGDEIKIVGFTAVRNGREKEVTLSRPRSEPASLVEIFDTYMELGTAAKLESVRGYLKYANSLRSGSDQIRIVDDSGKPTTIIVPDGLMDDIVRPMWDYLVEVTGPKIGKKIQLADIRRVQPTEA